MDTKSIGTNGPSIHTGVTSSRVKKSDKAENANESQAQGTATQARDDFKVSLSDRAQEMMEARQTALNLAKNTSPIREDLVASLRERIKNGTYELDPGKIADGILKEAIRDELAKNPEA
ncbi:flagellar biosynthesis anti-sigma factor FlgM [Pseudobacteriovorax antillogorgiicola]|uniref:Negative regulator of flagellin synthesis n=1 Tax=Pseudobacteriovorax antillogorgiicola TaxID=1513793 RepID=A0A1Y6B6Z6_9BACT|nr:flagellar biosynthesis anti-sigma factor FlgM [Pseudobacteriovorax antillogorgiicola]TCS59530.1 FlgM family anti-sigma-28 factor [Pseudobacteriovorax antillogorgiicola]SME87824.1 anti-sigma-28 factor, FlgM family [Pseudobacteriovorax antillogorgiicola]